MKNITKFLLFAVSLFFVVGISPAFAQQWGTTFSFTCISNNLSKDCNTGEQQLRLEILTPATPTYDIRFTFINTGPKSSAITDIYFDDPTILASIGFLDYTDVKIQDKTADVAFSPDATPPDLPSGNDAPVKFTADYSADSDAPPSQLGVNPGESVYLQFNYNGDYADGEEAVNALISAIASGSFSIGLHVQSFRTGGSESFVLKLNADEAPVPVPEPATILLLGTGLAGLAGAARRRRKKM